MRFINRILSLLFCGTVVCSISLLNVDATDASIGGSTSNIGEYTVISDRASKLNVTVTDGNSTFGASNVYKSSSRDGTVLQNSKLTIKASSGVNLSSYFDTNNVNKSDLESNAFIASSRVYLANTSNIGDTSIEDDNITPRGEEKGGIKYNKEYVFSSVNNKVWDKRSFSIGSAKTYYICYEVLLAKHPHHPCRYYFTLDTAKTESEQKKKNTAQVVNKTYIQGFSDGSRATCKVGDELKVLVYCQSSTSARVDYTLTYNRLGGKIEGQTAFVIVIADVDDVTPSGDGYLKTYGITFSEAGTYILSSSMWRTKGTGGGQPSQITMYIDVEENDQSDSTEYSLSFDEQQRIDELNRERESEENSALWSGMYIFFAICGILVLIYSLLIVIAYYIDILNSFTSVSLLNKITFGGMYPVASKDESVSVESKTVHIVSHKEIWISFCIGVMAATVMFNSKEFILFLYRAFEWMSNIF